MAPGHLTSSWSFMWWMLSELPNFSPLFCFHVLLSVQTEEEEMVLGSSESIHHMNDQDDVRWPGAYVPCTMWMLYYVNAVLCVALKCSSTCAAGMQYLVSFPDPLWEAERGSSVLSDISCHKGHHKECLNRIFKSRTYVSNALVHMDYHTTPFTKPRDHWKVCWDSQKQAVKQDFSLVQNMITCSMQI